MFQRMMSSVVNEDADVARHIAFYEHREVVATMKHTVDIYFVTRRPSGGIQIGMGNEEDS